MICEVWQYRGNHDDLVLIVKTNDGMFVINGFYYLTEERQKEFNAEFKGLIDWPWISDCQNEDYNLTLERFQKGERAQYIVCSCCDVGSWRNEKGEKIKEPDPKDYPWRDE